MVLFLDLVLFSRHAYDDNLDVFSKRTRCIIVEDETLLALVLRGNNQVNAVAVTASPSAMLFTDQIGGSSR